MAKEVTLPSGAKLRITVAPFADSKALYQAFASEIRSVKMDPSMEIDTNFKKDFIMTLVASKTVEACLVKCMERCTYNDVKITSDTFEPVEARDDYFTVCIQVAWENVYPFMKSLYAQFAPILEKLKASLA